MKPNKVKQVDLVEMFNQMFLTGQDCIVEINRIHLRINLMRSPKGIGVGVNKQHGDSSGMSRGVRNVEEAISTLRSYFKSIAKVELPEIVEPPVRTWFVYICRGNHYPIYEGSYAPNLDDYLVTDSEVKEGEYAFNIPAKIAPELSDFPRDGDTVFIPKYSVWHVTDYVETVKVDYDRSR